ncbi:hypothetical protein AKJ45_02165 [candidate division MSBL1 archaeon SCGC-AAA261F19]|uniref:HTH cro/C1-type domain-containing protein n=1 Tax=candidate division MSBL1 archaeon SCGC-AAA261F19 TaxID=1698275 RepID=A0A133V9V7_9EURY|nr:hypothetical protein AKJ45_02165 [candidate division MSBL1 archaeon SCGC-AAA261F19]
MRPPCEIVVTKVLPAIRTVLVMDLIDRHELTQKEVAEKLDVTQAAVSQYLSSIRGDEEIERKLQKSKLFSKIQKLSDKIASGKYQKSQIIKDFCGICDLMRKKGILCKIHSDSAPSLSKEKCDACF